jgi:four helix bundle protein
MIQSFTGLEAWKEGHKLALTVYQITENFPDKERFGLISQLRRAAVSVTSNIAEGFNRGDVKDKIRFYLFSRGSLAEIQNQLLIAKDIGFLKKEEFENIAQKTILVHKLLNGLIKSLNRFIK